MRHAEHPALRLSAGLAVLALTGLGCESGNGDDVPLDAAPGSTTTTTASTTTSTVAQVTTTTTAPPTPEEEVLVAYLNYWKAVDAAFDPSEAEPDLPALRQYATGEALAGITASARTSLEQNRARRIPENGRYVHRAEVLAVDGETATVRDCTIDDTVIIDTITGAVLDDAVSTRLYISTMVREAGQWKLAQQNREMGWEGEAGCALEAQ